MADFYQAIGIISSHYCMRVACIGQVEFPEQVFVFQIGQKKYMPAKACGGVDGSWQTSSYIFVIMAGKGYLLQFIGATVSA